MKFSEWIENEQLNDADIVYRTRRIDPGAQGVSLRSVWAARTGRGIGTLRIAFLLKELTMDRVPISEFVDGAWLDEVRRRAAEEERRG